MPWNAGRWRLDVMDGRAAVARTEGAPDLALDANDLGLLFLGAAQRPRLPRRSSGGASPGASPPPMASSHATRPGAPGVLARAVRRCMPLLSAAFLAHGLVSPLAPVLAAARPARAGPRGADRASRPASIHAARMLCKRLRRGWTSRRGQGGDEQPHERTWTCVSKARRSQRRHRPSGRAD